QAAVIAAAAWVAGGHDGHVADLAGHAEIAMQDVTIGDDTAADSGAEREQNQIVDIAARSYPRLAERSSVRVVFKNHGRAVSLRDLGGQGVAFKFRHIVRANDFSYFDQNEAGNADADTAQIARAKL